jgi:hypothetical protein
LSLLLPAIAPIAHAQFKVIGPAPYPPAEARQKIRTLLEKTDPSNTQQAIDTLSGLVTWYRDILDEELIAAWQKDGRGNLTGVLKPLADLRVASGIIESSWRQQRQATFNLIYAPTLGDLMFRFPDSAKPFLNDLLGQPPPALPPSQAEAVCRILLDMPDDGTWKKSALQILPHYRPAAEMLLDRDLHGEDSEKNYRARRWLADLKFTAPASTAPTSGRPDLRRNPSPAPAAPESPRTTASYPPPQPPPVSSAVMPYNGARSGTLECSGGPVPQNAEYVFRNLPPLKMRLDYDTNNWEARVVPGDKPGTQRLILKNKSSGPLKHCTVHWSLME